ncbi:MAG: ATP-binding cassette domain-containing protein [Bacteroidota bacterium]
MIKTQGLSKRFGGLTALDALHLDIPADACWGLFGPNGSGKSTLLHCLSGYLEPDQGEIWIGGQNTRMLAPFALAKLGLIRGFQGTYLVDGLTVLEHVLLGQHQHIPSSFFPKLPFLSSDHPEKKARQKALEWLDFLGIADQANQLVQRLPYGMQRQVELARLLAAEPKFLLLDEPGAGLNAEEREAFFEQITAARKSAGFGLLVIAHHFSLLSQMADHLVMLHQGKIVASGPADSIVQEAVVREHYLL